MTLMDTVGVQQSIITDELEDDEDGIEAWVAALISHFEYSTDDLRAEALHHAWDEEELKNGEHPDVLWARLTSIQRKLHKGNVRIYLSRKDGLWTLLQVAQLQSPEQQRRTVASLRMNWGGTPANDTTWHERLGHPSQKKTL